MSPILFSAIVFTLLCKSEIACTDQLSSSTLTETSLVASSAQAGFGAQNAAQSAAQSNASSAAAASSAPTAPSTQAPTYSPPAFSTTPPVVLPSASSTPDPKASDLSVPTTLSPAAPVLREFIKPTSTTDAHPQEGSIESYFRFHAANVTDSAGAKVAQDRANQKKSSRGSVGRGLWHILDNLGVPMFSGDLTPDLDPRLSRDYVDPPMPSMDSKKIKVGSGEGTQANTSSIESIKTRTNADERTKTDTSSVAPRLRSPKIPDSELQGTEFTHPPDVH